MYLLVPSFFSNGVCFQTKTGQVGLPKQAPGFQTKGFLTIIAHSTRTSPCCPLCDTPAQRFHSRYIRRITDLPSGGNRICLQVLIRKCFCDVSTCARKIFAERLTPFVKPLARVTSRLFQVVQAIGLATGGMLGARYVNQAAIFRRYTTVSSALRSKIISSIVSWNQ
jgi:transposase